MEHRKTPTSNITMIDASNNNNSYRNHQKKKKRTTTKRQQLPSSSLTHKHQHIPSVIITDPNCNQPKIHVQDKHISMKNPLGWTKKWTKWFSSCNSEHASQTNLNPSSTSIDKHGRTKSENDVLKRDSIEHDDKKKLSATTSNFSIEQNEHPEERPSRKSSHQQHHHYQSNERVNNSNITLNRDINRRYSNPFFISARHGRSSITNIPITTTTSNNTQRKQPSHLSRSVDRLHNKSRQLRYEEHDDYIPPPPLHSIQCHPTIEHYTRSLNQSSYFSSHHRRSQIEAYQASSINHRVILPKPYSSLYIPHSQSVQIMSRTSADNNNTYGKLSECHSPLAPLENSSVKAPRRIESQYSQFPLQQEPVYANTQSLYDNILYPQSASKYGTRNTTNPQEKKSCASQTQLTWTMATFSSFVDLENQSAIIPQPDTNTLYSVVQHPQSPHTVEQTSRISPRLPHIDDASPSSSHYQRPRSPASSTSIMIEKRDGSFQTHLTIAPTQDIQSNSQILKHESTPSPVSTGSSATPGHHHHHHHHHHRKHKSRNHTSSGSITTRDVGLQVNIQTVKKITFTPQKSDESSLATTTTPSSPGTLRVSPESKNVETNTEPLVTKRDMSTSYESGIHLITSSSQTTDSSSTTTTAINRQTKAAQTPNKTLRDQSIETNNLGLFVCDLSSLLKNGSDEATSGTTKRKS